MSNYLKKAMKLKDRYGCYTQPFTYAQIQQQNKQLDNRSSYSFYYKAALLET